MRAPNFLPFWKTLVSLTNVRASIRLHDGEIEEAVLSEVAHLLKSYDKPVSRFDDVTLEFDAPLAHFFGPRRYPGLSTCDRGAIKVRQTGSVRHLYYNLRSELSLGWFAVGIIGLFTIATVDDGWRLGLKASILGTAFFVVMKFWEAVRIRWLFWRAISFD